ncbi:19655_t:CDS:2, partial [Cetraspora pellucida]
SSIPETTLPVPSNAIIGIVNTRNGDNEKKIKKAKIGKVSLTCHMIHIGPIKNLRDWLNACCQNRKYASEQEQEIVQKVIKKFKSDFPTFPVSVEDFVLQKLTEDIIENW